MSKQQKMAKQQRLSNDEFLTQLSSLLNSTHSRHHASVFLTQKRLVGQTDKSNSDPLADLTTPSPPLPILIRATNGVRPARLRANNSAQAVKDDASKIKLATVVEADDLEGFYEKYGEVCKAGMANGLKKRDRRKQKDRKKKGKKGTEEKKA